MSHGKELPTVGEDSTSRPTFELARRGYDKQQVDQYVLAAEGEISTLTAERGKAFGQIQTLATQFQQLQAELTELHQRPPQVDRASFRHLGPMVDQILALAEKQAEAITNTAAQWVADHQSDAEKVLADTREQADKLKAESEAAYLRAEEEAKQSSEQSAQQLETARTEAEGMIEAARVQIQQEVEAVGAQTQQELAQWKANVERESNERRAAAERELARLRTMTEQKNASLHAEAQQYSADLRRRADEQAGAHQQQLTVVQQDIQSRQQALAQLHAELESAQQQLAQSRQKGATTDGEVAQLQQLLGEVRQNLTSELTRLDEARRAAEAADRHAVDVRARVQREAKRVADLAAAAVMAAAAGGGVDTGEYPMVTVRADDNRTAPEAVAAHAAKPDPDRANGEASEPRVVGSDADRVAEEASEPRVVGSDADRAADEAIEAPADNVPAEAAPPGGHARHGVDKDIDNAVPAQREPQQQRVAADAE